MSENAKTISFLAAGLVAVVVGLFSAPSTAVVDESSLVGTNLTKAFDSPEKAKRLRIVRYDEETATLREFEVSEKDGLWTIPSKDAYPADAARQMAEASTALMDRKVLHLASKVASDHEQYGVVDPLSPKLGPGQKGVGTRVTISDDSSKPLADLIVGKGVRDAENQRYVREAGRDAVYAIEIDPTKLSTNFEDWIEKDLLKLNGWDLQQVEVKDYSAEMGLVMGPDGRPSIGVAWDPRSELTLGYDDAQSKWAPIKLRKFNPKKGGQGDYEEIVLAEDEELNSDSLNALKTSLDDLKIVDVRRKPQGLSDNLKAGEDFMSNREALESLIQKGFAATATKEGGPRDLISSDGEVIATMKNGAEYVLRFGNLTNVSGGDKSKADGASQETAGTDAAAEGKEKKDGKSDVHRYLFVMARFNEGAVKRPELVELPEVPAAGQDKKDEAAESKEKDKKAEVEEKTAEKTEPSDEAAAKANEASDAEKTEKAVPTEEKDETKDETKEEAKGETKSEEKPSADETKKQGESNQELEKVIAERKKIEKENQQKLDEYQALIKKGQENVKELNLRFGDWYFIVDDEVFQKVRVSHDKVIKKKEKKAEGDAAAPGGAAPPVGIPGLPTIPGAQP